MRTELSDKRVEGSRTAVIIGAGPAGLTAAYELLKRTDIKPVVLEKSAYIGGISRTIVHNGNRMDIGGHRFFSKSDRVMDWWRGFMPVETEKNSILLTYRNQTRTLSTAPPVAAAPTNGPNNERVMLLRRRKSRIYFLRKFFSYPVQLNWQTLTNLGWVRTTRIIGSYVRAKLRRTQIKSLEDFFINRFGRELYQLFFKSYTEKVWGMACNQISAEWGEQRIKGLSIGKAILHHVKWPFHRNGDRVRQKNTETSLIERFLYPKYGPGQMWEEVASEIERLGGVILKHSEVTSLAVNGNSISEVRCVNGDRQKRTFASDFVFSTMPVKELIRALQCEVPSPVLAVSDGLQYRDFITVGLLLNSLKIKDTKQRYGGLIEDNWIYIQEPDVLAGRLQIFNNWSPHLVSDPAKPWLGVEYFCFESDPLWKLPDPEMAALAQEELQRIGIIDQHEVIDWHVERVAKTYPAYFGSYGQFDDIRDFVDRFENLFLVGRNGMHKYNNQDHSMLTAMTAVDNIIVGRTDKSNIWAINTEMEYHETQVEKTS